jgi:hypothetical protein
MNPALPGTMMICPDCHVGRVARSWVFADGLLLHLAILLLPFVIVGAIIWLLVRQGTTQGARA